jgi:hypothetical protein
MARRKKSAKRAGRTAADITPNDLAAPQSAADRAALKVTGKYLGKTYYEGDVIRHEGEEWQYRLGGWVRTQDLTPNHLPGPQTQEDSAALAVTCQYLGKTFYEGNKICYQSQQFVCTPTGWVKTGNDC